MEIERKERPLIDGGTKLARLMEIGIGGPLTRFFIQNLQKKVKGLKNVLPILLEHEHWVPQFSAILMLWKFNCTMSNK